MKMISIGFTLGAVLLFLSPAHCLGQFGQSRMNERPILLADLENLPEFEEYLIDALAGNQALQQALELSQRQVEEVQDRLQKLRDDPELRGRGASASALQEMSKEELESWFGDPEKRAREYRRRRDQIIAEVLTPEQQTQLKFHLFWSIVNRCGDFHKLFTVPRIAEATGVTPDDWEKLEPEFSRLEAEYQEKASQLRQQYRSRALRLLDREQRKTFREQFGEPQGQFPRFAF